MVSFDDLDRDDLMYLIGCYNNYVVEFYDNHEQGMFPVSVYEFFDNEFQEILRENGEMDYPKEV